MPYSALAQLFDIARFPQPDRGAVEIAGSDPVFPTRYRIGTAGSAAIAAAAVAAADLYALRNRKERRQTMAVDLRHAAAALRSYRYLRIDGTAAGEIRDPLTGLYSTRDQRRVFLHCNFANHRLAALHVLGLNNDAERDRVAQAVRGWDGSALEDAVHAAQGCAALVRTTAEWRQHPQAVAIEGLPLLAIERIGDAPPEPLEPGPRPLAGVRVLDLTRVLAGPTCARTLAEHGADVLKISAEHLPSSGDAEIDTGLGKRSAFLDLREASAQQTLSELIADGRCDVFSQSYCPGTLANRGLGESALASKRPGIVSVELCAWGNAGPWAGRRGFDTIVQCASGMALVEGGGTRPRIMSVSAIDYVSGYLMAFGTMVALRRRALEGGSWIVRVSLARTASWIVAQGLLDQAEIERVADDLPEHEIARIMMTTPSPRGLIQHLAPVARMSETPAQWARPPSALGQDAAVWPERRL